MNNVIMLDRECRECRECDDCGNMSVSRHVEKQEFDYGVEPNAVRLEADVPVWKCASCGSAYMDEAGMAARHDAVCRYLRMLTPLEVREVRGSASRQSFCDLTGIASASMKRWESGEQIQTPAMDLLLRLVRDPVASCRIRDIRSEHSQPAMAAIGAPKFRTEFTPRDIKKSREFQLRKVG